MTSGTLAMSPSTIARLPVDLLLETAAHDHLELQHQVVQYRELAQMAIALLHDRTRECDLLRQRYHDTLDELRALRRKAAA